MNADINNIKKFYLYFYIDGNNEYSIFNEEEKKFFTNQYLFINLFDKIPSSFEEYNDIVSNLNNKNETIIIFTLVDLFIKFYNSKPDKYCNLYTGLYKIQPNNTENEINISYKFYYDLLKKLLNIIENYFIYYHYVQDKDEYFTNLTNIIFENDYIEKDFKLFIKNMNIFIDNFIDELNTTKYIFDYLHKLKKIYDNKKN
jgi:hypothetical protein